MAVQVTLTLNSHKKHSVRFDARLPQPDLKAIPALTSVYLSNEAYKALGQPSAITVTVEAAL